MLTLTDVHAGYGRASVLHGVSLEVAKGEVVSLLGANGAGKSTTLKTISGVVRARQGRLRFDGRDITAAQPGAIVKLGLVHCPEGRQVFPDLTVRENLQMGAYARGSRKRIDKVLETFPALRDRLQQTAGTLSGGEQQMLAIGRALMAEPRLLLLDEPSLGLAPLIVEWIFQIIAGFRDEGVSVLLVEQNATLALGVADRAYVLSHGEVRHSGSADEVKTSEALKKAYLG
jgi:branched-chain amino acid transport system ATP-binding protein